MKNVGIHRISCKAIQDLNFDMLLKGEKVNILYSDPPWGDGNLKYWNTMKAKATGKRASELKHDELMDIFKDLIDTHVKGFVFIETGLRWYEVFMNHLSGSIKDIKVVKLIYKSGSKSLENVLFYGNNIGVKTPTIDIFHKSGYEVPQICINRLAVKGGIVLDPCCGMGYSARASIEAGMRFRGNEFNPKRLEKTERLLEKYGRY